MPAEKGRPDAETERSSSSETGGSQRWLPADEIYKSAVGCLYVVYASVLLFCPPTNADAADDNTERQRRRRCW